MKLVIEIPDEQIEGVILEFQSNWDANEGNCHSFFKQRMIDKKVDWTIGSGFIKYMQIRIKEELEAK